MASTISTIRICCLAIFLVTLNFKPLWSQFTIADRITTQDGLSNNTVTDIFQDSTGYLWIATLNGLNRYDGIDIQPYFFEPGNPNSLSHNVLVNINQDNDGVLWIGSERHVTILNPYSDELQRLILKRDVPVTAIEVLPSGEKLLGTIGLGLMKTTGETTQTVLSEEIKINCLLSDTSGIWVGTEENGLIRLDSNLESRPLDENINWPVRNIIPSKHFPGKAYVGTTGGGVFELDLLKGKIRSLEVDPLLVLVLLEDKNGKFWVGTDGGGLLVYNITASADQRISLSEHTRFDTNELGNDVILSLFQDRSGVVWAGIKDNGLIKFSNWQLGFRQISKPSTEIWELFEIEGNVHVGTNHGITYIDLEGGSFRRFSINNLNNKTIRVLACADSIVWVATMYHGLYKLDLRTNVCQPVNANFKPRDKINIYSMIHDDSTMWIGTNGNGLLRLSLKKSEPVLETVSLLSAGIPDLRGWIVTIAKDSHKNLWLGTWGRGLIKYNPRTKESVVFSFNYNSAAKLASNTILHVLPDSVAGCLWIGTYGGGLNCLDANGGITHIGRSQGLSGNIIYATEKGFQNNILWISTDKGLSRIDTKSMSIENFSYPDDFPKIEFNLGASLKLNDSLIYFGGTGGLVSIGKDNFQYSKPPESRITYVKIHNKKIALSQPLNKKSELRFSHYDNVLTFGFHGFQYENPDKVHYAWMLEGFDNDWQHCSGCREAVYKDIEPGDYEFKVKSASGSAWSSVAVVPVSIRGPFWKSWWFLGVCLAGLALTGEVIHRLRVRKALALQSMILKEKERIQKKIADDFHDELSHRVTRVKLQSQLLKSEKGSDQQKEIIEKIIDNADELFNDVRGFIWELDPHKDSVYDLAVYLKSFSDQLFEDKEIAFQIYGLDPKMEQVKLSLQQRQEISRIFKEGLHNILKHAQTAKNVVLSVQLEEKHQITFTLCDDGEGFDPDALYYSNGLNHMRERARLIGAHFEIKAKPGFGSTIILILKLP